MFWKNKNKEIITKAKWLVLALLLVAVVAGFGAGIIGAYFLKSNFVNNNYSMVSLNNLDANLRELISKFGQLSEGEKSQPLEMVIRQATTASFKGIATTIAVGGFWDNLEKGSYDIYLNKTKSGFKDFYEADDLLGRATVLSSDGWLLTSGKIFSGKKLADFVFVSYDHHLYRAEKIIKDDWSDLVMIKINANNLPLLSFRESEPAFGETIIAFAGDKNFWFANFSGLSADSGTSVPQIDGVFKITREFDSLPLGNFIADDAGKILAIVAMDRSGKKNIIPFYYWQNQIDQVFRTGQFQRGDVGFSYLDLSNNILTEKDVATLKLDKSPDHGLLVSNIFSSSPAYGAGLRLNDVVVKINGFDIYNIFDFRSVLADLKIGDRIELTVLEESGEAVIGFDLASAVK